MKKKIFTIICLAICTLAMSCHPYEDPHRYKGCVVVQLSDLPNNPNVHLKLREGLRDSIHKDYLWIKVPKWELNQLHVSDTIK